MSVQCCIIAKKARLTMNGKLGKNIQRGRARVKVPIIIQWVYSCENNKKFPFSLELIRTSQNNRKNFLVQNVWLKRCSDGQWEKCSWKKKLNLTVYFNFEDLRLDWKLRFLVCWGDFMWNEMENETGYLKEFKSILGDGGTL